MIKKQVAVVTTLTFIFALSVSVSAITKTITLRVQGMTCGGCATSVENALKSTDGVEEARVNFKSGKAVIKYNDQKVTVTRLREVISNTGFFCDMEDSSGKKGR